MKSILNITSVNDIKNDQALTLDAVEKQHIIKILKTNQGNKTKTAKTLGISLKTLYNKIKEINHEVL